MSDVWRLYDANAEAFDRDRGRSLPERLYLDELISRLDPAHRHVLDLGCGAGEPIARYLVEAGCHVTGVDAAPGMIALCRARFPDLTWIEHDMRTLALGQRFDAIVAWDSFFHLQEQQQRRMFPVFRDHVAAGGLLLFTSGPDQGVAIGKLYGEDLYHASLTGAEYATLLREQGFEVLLHRVEDPDCGGHTVWLARAPV
jgi:trans-aconitate methyltransferase